MNSKIKIDLQIETRQSGLPDERQIEQWVNTSLQSEYSHLEQTIRIVDKAESRKLNHNYRAKNKPTNVIAFAADDSDYLDYEHLGDLVICAPVVEQEAIEQNKEPVAHWAHMVVHGMLHLQGFEHLTDADAQKMETLEIEILLSLGHTNPYQVTLEGENG